jgi:HEAT repeat protein
LDRPALKSACLLLVLLFVAPFDAGADADKWRSRFDKNDADDVYAAIELAAERKDFDAGIPLLEKGIAAHFPHISIACGEALQKMGWPGEEKAEIRAAEKVLKKALKTKDEREQQNLARVLGTWGHPLVDEHMAQLASGRRPPSVQAESLLMCGSLRPTPEAPFKKTMQVIEKAFKNKTPDVRAAACSAAGRMGDKSLVEGLVALIRRDKDDYPGLYGVWALTKIGYDGGIGTFVHVLGSNPKRVTREACLKAITELSTKNDVEDLLSLSRQNKTDYRDAAALALGRIAWRGGYRVAQATGEDAQRATQEVPDAVIERLVSMVEQEGDWETRMAARTSLLRIGEPSRAMVQARLPNSVDFSDEDTRLTCIELCGLFGAEDAYKNIYKIAIYDKSRTVRMFAARALEGIQPEKAVQELAEVVAGHGKKAREYELQAVRALGYIRKDSALDALIKVVESGTENEEILREVEFAMERLTGHRFGRRPDRWRKWLETAKHPLHPMIGKYDRQANRREALSRGLYGLTTETERAVENGLRWLELQQHPIGFWDGNEKGFGGVVNCEPAYTGLSLLAFLGAGYNGREGKYRETVRRAAEFLAATQFYDGGFPVTGGSDNSWIYAYLIAMGIWGVTEGYALAAMDELKEPAQWGIDYLVRVQTPGGGWRYGPRYHQSDTSCTSWVLMTLKAGDLVGLQVSQRGYDGIDSWLERCAYDITGEEEIPEDLSTDYDYEVGSKRFYKSFMGYFELSGAEKSALQQTSMTAVGMVCRFFMGWKRSHPFLIGCGNYLEDYLPLWMRGLEKGQAIAWYHYYWYYGTLAMHQMGGRFWRHWNEKIRRMYPEQQRRSPPELYGSWDPDTAVLNGGRLFSTAMSILALETYYRFSPLLGDSDAGAGDGDGDGDGK